MKKASSLLFVIFLLLTGLNSCKKKSTSIETVPVLRADDILFSFVVMGDSRITKEDTNYLKYPAATNFEEVNQSWTEIAALSPAPDFVFVNGDQSLGHVWDTVRLENECLAYINDYKNSALYSQPQIKFYAIPGNHELLYTDSLDSEHFWPNSEHIWLKCFGDYVAASNGPNAGGPDSLLYDESRLTCSFDHKGVHFTIINTDTYNKMGSFPINWVTTDIQNARQNRAIKQIFVINHRPAYGSGISSEPPTGDSIYSILWQVMEANHCVAMISSHEHLFFKKQINNKVWQIITGCAGAKLDNVPDSMKYFGYTIIQVMANGDIIEKTMGRNVPKAGYLAKPDAPTILRDSANIAW